jgi:hypothetical protein
VRGSGRRFVVDADVARAALDPDKVERGAAVAPVALAAYRALNALHEAKHTVVFSPALTAEWARHAPEPRFARRWLIRMVEARLVDRLAVEPEDAALQAAVSAGLAGGDRAVAEKDLHLVTVALNQADQRLLSSDGRAREKYARLTAAEPRLAGLHWVAPADPEVVAWLRERAPDAAGRRLGG